MPARRALFLLMPMDFSIIIVNYNMKQLVCECLDSLALLDEGCSFETILVDNDSADGSPAHIQDNYPWVRLVANDWNAGFAKACNQGWEISSGDIVLFLNPDTEMSAGTLPAVNDFFKSTPHAGIAGCRTVNSDGSLEPSVYREPTLWRTFVDSFYLGKWFGGYEVPPESMTGDAEVEAVCGACFFATRALLQEVGAFDEEFWMYGEDIELCLRARRAGYGVHYLNGVSVIHKRGQRHLSEDAYHDMARISYNHYKWIFYFFRKHYPAWWNDALRRIMAVQVGRKLVSRKKKLDAGDDSRDNRLRIKGLERVMNEFIRHDGSFE